MRWTVRIVIGDLPESRIPPSLLGGSGLRSITRASTPTVSRRLRARETLLSHHKTKKDSALQLPLEFCLPIDPGNRGGMEVVKVVFWNSDRDVNSTVTLFLPQGSLFVTYGGS